jgi:GNAT superfamily N-acetyltransferase
MLWRIRAVLPDRPGTLAVLARECGESGVDIKTLHVFYEGGGTVTDELVVHAPAEWAADRLSRLVARAGGRCVAVLPCGEAAVVDQPTRYVDAARATLARPTSFPEIVARLFDADTVPGGPGGPPEDVMELTVGSAVVQVRRTTPFTAAEHARGAAMADLVTEVLAREAPPAPVGPEVGLGPEYVATDDTVTALVAGTVAGRASVAIESAVDRPWLVDVWVDPGWQRRGIGARLLVDVARLARGRGAEEILLSAPASSPAVLPMVLSAGLRGRIRLTGDTVTVRIALVAADAQPQSNGGRTVPSSR